MHTCTSFKLVEGRGSSPYKQSALKMKEEAFKIDRLFSIRILLVYIISLICMLVPVLAIKIIQILSILSLLLITNPPNKSSLQ